MKRVLSTAFPMTTSRRCSDWRVTLIIRQSRRRHANWDVPYLRPDENLNPSGDPNLKLDIARLRRRLSEVVAIDFFDSLGRQSAEGLFASLEARLNPDTSTESRAASSSSEYHRRVWVTRKGIHVDRMASAWLIKRFIDPEAKFKFVPARGYQPEKLEIRFDMFEADFTHEGDRCTFEVLLNRMKLNALSLRPIAEIVHDIDLKDGKFGRPEAPGIERLITGICTVHKDDESRLVRASWRSLTTCMERSQRRTRDSQK